jgi:hypothetical protein
MTTRTSRERRAEALDARAMTILARDRESLLELLRNLETNERHRHYATLGFPSLWAYVTQRLGFCDASADRRIASMRLARKFPVIATYLGNGRLNMSQVCALRRVLTADNVRALLEGAMGKSEKVLAAMAAGMSQAPMAKPRGTLRPVQLPPDFALAVSPGSAGGNSGAEVDRERIAPVVDELHQLKVLVGKAFREDLEALCDALAHTYPDRDLESVLHHAVKVALETMRKQKEGSGTRKARPADETSSRVPRSVARAVMQRDGRRCTFTAADGRRCEATHLLEFDHLVPVALGGATTVANLAIKCSTHNQLRARIELGDERVDQAIASRRGAAMHSGAEVKERAMACGSGDGHDAGLHHLAGQLQSSAWRSRTT